MIEQDLILAKAGTIKKRLSRIASKRQPDIESFEENLDSQEIILFNIQMAIQDCIDIAAHIISEKGWGIPGSTNEMFYLLEENDFLNRDLTEKLVKCVGFRNLLVHAYSRIEVDRVFEITQKDILDLETYLKFILIKLGLR